MTVTVVGSLLGLALPFVARKLGTDPATLSSPMLTSIMDLLGVLIYFGFAYVFLGSALAGA
jgi:magnesium transporter